MNDILEYLKSLFAFNEGHPLLFTQIHFWVIFFIIYIFFTIIVHHWHKKGRTSSMSMVKRLFRNGYLFLFSLFFYFKTSGEFVGLLIFSTMLGWWLGMDMDDTKSRIHRKTLMIIGVAVNLLVLCYFKYAYFFTDIFNATFHTEYSIAIKIFLPVGISFYTFQNISYIVDVYKRKIPHVTNLLDFGFYTSFFPQLVAGPILRADQFIPQIYKPFFLSRRQFGIAVFWILNGLIKKLVLSDYIATCFIDRVFELPNLFSPFENFSSLLLYSLQVYADFSGYTDIAIGVAMLMGFYLPVNFNSPYKAQNPTDFWHRWHMSLSRWLRDYLYIPLGGNRTAGVTSYAILVVILIIAAFRFNTLWFTIVVTAIILAVILMRIFWKSHRRTLGTNVNNMDTMLLGGMWHGSSFNFIIWGGLNGLGILIYKWWKDRRWPIRFLSLASLTLLLTLLRLPITIFGFHFSVFHSPLLNIFWYCAIILLIGFTIVFIFGKIKSLSTFHFHYSTCWSVIITFIFISFTRLFFRSGSNLDPASANKQALDTAEIMVDRIGSQWDLSQIQTTLKSYGDPKLWIFGNVFFLFAIGMIIHWLPTRFKRRYRIWFSSMPLWLMVLVCVITAVVLYQYVTARLQPFIYFQF
jgi:D-alanyl-lipoteichoic acid acyltransferase DltB (MBOAT superfamily)